MNLLEQLQSKIETILQKMENLELENMELREELVKTKQDKQEAMTSIDNLLERLQQVKCLQQAANNK